MEDSILKNASPFLAVSGKNISLADRTRKPYVASRRFDIKKKYFCNSPTESRSDSKRDSAHNKLECHKKCKKMLTRTAFNLPVKCLPGGVFGEARNAEKRKRPVHDNNRTLIEIREAKQASDFQRILGSNAILFGTARSLASPLFTEMYSDAPLDDAVSRKRPSSSYSVWNVSETYNYLFQRHLDSLKTVLGDRLDDGLSLDSPNSVTVRDERLYEELYNLSEYYDEVCPPKRTESARAEVTPVVRNCANNFNVNLSDLISLGECVQDDSLIMSTPDEDLELERRIRQLRLTKSDVPAITLTECREPSTPSPVPHNIDDSFTLNVPSVECDVAESRPPLAD